MRLLAGDIGGTKTELAIYEGAAAEPRELRELQRARFASHAHAGLLEIALPFLAGRALDAAAFAVAGPVHERHARTTNLPWVLDEPGLSRALGAPVLLLNDFAAIVHGVGELGADGLHVLAVGERDANGPIAVLGAGTGLGEAIGVPTPVGLRVLPSEGGHADFAPRDETELRLLQFLRQRLAGRVSIERVLSGPGLVRLYDFVVADGLAPEDPAVRARMAGEDPSQVVATLGAEGGDLACTRALDLFVGLYGAEAGNLALKVLPTGGLFIAGGIAPKLRARLARGDLVEAMLDKGRMREVLARIPVAIVLDARVGLLGARAAAEQLARVPAS